MRSVTSLLAVVLGGALLAGHVHAKGEGVGLWMEGTVANVRAEGKRTHLVLTGRFWLEQYRGNVRSVVEVDGRRGIPVTVVQAEPFFAMTTNWGGGSIRAQGALLPILETAAERKRTVKLELLDAKLVFGREGHFEVTEGAVIRVTDADLR